MNLLTFSIFNITGSALWNVLLIGLDAALGTQYALIDQYSQYFNCAVYAAIGVAIVLLSGGRARAFTIAAGVTFAITMGLSRVYLGHHWFTDVLVAWLLGSARLGLVITAHRLYLTTRSRAGYVVQRAVDLRHRPRVTSLCNSCPTSRASGLAGVAVEAHGDLAAEV